MRLMLLLLIYIGILHFFQFGSRFTLYILSYQFKSSMHVPMHQKQCLNKALNNRNKQDSQDHILTCNSVSLFNGDEGLRKRRKQKLSLSLITNQNYKQASLKNRDKYISEPQQKKKENLSNCLRNEGMLQKEENNILTSFSNENNKVQITRKNRIFNHFGRFQTHNLNLQSEEQRQQEFKGRNGRKIFINRPKYELLDHQSNKAQSIFIGKQKAKQSILLKSGYQTQFIGNTNENKNIVSPYQKLIPNQFKQQLIEQSSFLATSEIRQFSPYETERFCQGKNEQNHRNPASRKVKRTHGTKRKVSHSLQMHIYRKCQTTLINKPPIDINYYSNSVGPRLIPFSILHENYIGSSLIDHKLLVAHSRCESQSERQTERYFDREEKLTKDKVSYRNIDIQNNNADTLNQTQQLRHHNIFSDFQYSAKKLTQRILREDTKSYSQIQQPQNKRRVPHKYNFHFLLVALAIILLIIQALA